MSKPDCPQDFPYTIELEAGDYWWCACGKSNIQPLCDGSHKTTEFEPVKFTITEKKTYSLCGCKNPATPLIVMAAIIKDECSTRYTKHKSE